MFAKLGRALGLALVAAALAGCSSAPIRLVTDTYQSLVYKTRTKGEKETAKPDTVKQELGCSARKPFELKLEFSELVPARFRSGREVNHRFTYAACTPRDAAQTYALVRRISRGGKVLFEDRDSDFVVKPGRWVVDAFVGIPDSAAPGSYSLELAFEPRGGSARSLRFNFEVTN